MRHLFLTSILLTILIINCQCERAKLSKIPLKVSIERFEQELFECDEDSLVGQISLWQQKYGEFFDFYCSGIIGVGTPENEDFLDNLKGFLMADIVQESYQMSQEIFDELTSFDKQLTLAFKRYKLHFPNDTVPRIVSYVSGFNQSIMLTQDIIGVGLDKYLGADYENYPLLGFYKYMIRNMIPEKLATDIISSWAKGIFPYQVRADELISRMIWEGKILYFTKQLLPNEADTCIFGFSKEQLTSCRSNEGFMWLHLVEKKLLFTGHPFTIAKFTEERPFTQEFSREAPGKAANWLGYRLVKKYMEQNDKITLKDLMLSNNYRQILEESGYNPR
ncbi:MAG: hypothetical protein ACRCZB_04610 [Bacteroidales bacterium]